MNLKKHYRWTKQEDQYLKDNYLSKTHLEISSSLNRDVLAVRSRCHKLDLIKQLQIPWSENEEKYLLDNFDSLSYVEMSLFLNRTERSLRDKCHALDLFRFKQHKLSNHPLHNHWNNMKGRCYNINADNYGLYGGRNIMVCDDWFNFEVFYNWAINNGWQSGLQIDRINNDDDYSSQNCRWVTPKQNSNNKRNNVLLTAFGETKTVMLWFEDNRCRCKSYQALRWRLKKNWSVEEAITKDTRYKDKSNAK